jgi:anti-sigma factor RsiW
VKPQHFISAAAVICVGLLAVIVIPHVSGNANHSQDLQAQSPASVQQSSAPTQAVGTNHPVSTGASVSTQNQKMEDEVRGTSTTFAEFSANAQTDGLKVGQRFSFIATPSVADKRYSWLCAPGSPGGTSCIAAVADFDERDNLKGVILAMTRKYDASCTIVASLEADRKIHIHRGDVCY